jgi:hypothetical protein
MTSIYVAKGLNMEKRKRADRREAHLFVADERRKGPHERRGADSRLLERERERQKIERIRAFKEKDKTVSHSAPLFTKKRLLYLGLALLVVMVALLLIN